MVRDLEKKSAQRNAHAMRTHLNFSYIIYAKKRRLLPTLSELFFLFFFVQQHTKKNAYILWCFYLKANICILHDKKIVKKNKNNDLSDVKK